MQFKLIDYLHTFWSSLLVLIKKEQTSLRDLFYYFWRVKINKLFQSLYNQKLFDGSECKLIYFFTYQVNTS